MCVQRSASEGVTRRCLPAAERQFAAAPPEHGTPKHTIRRSDSRCGVHALVAVGRPPWWCSCHHCTDGGCSSPQDEGDLEDEYDGGSVPDDPIRVLPRHPKIRDPFEPRWVPPSCLFDEQLDCVASQLVWLLNMLLHSVGGMPSGRKQQQQQLLHPPVAWLAIKATSATYVLSWC